MIYELHRVGHDWSDLAAAAAVQNRKKKKKIHTNVKCLLAFDMT